VIYETFSRTNAVMPRFSFAAKRRLRNDFPSLHPKVKFVASYFDASVHEPERLALDLVADALATGNAKVVTYAAATGADSGAVLLTDALTGTVIRTTADVVINASGPLTDLTNEALGRETKFMGGTKGSHIVVDHPKLYAELAGRELFFENSDGRIVLIYPVKGRVLIGTTDIFADPREPARCTEAEVDYFFDLVGHIMPGIELDRSQIVFRFSGIRPLPKQDVSQPGFVSRDYRIDRDVLPGSHDTPFFSVVGGKWTTFRALGEHVSNLALEIIGRPRVISTKGLEIGGGKRLPQSAKAVDAWVSKFSAVLGQERARVLLARYGTRAEPLIKWLETHGDHALANLSGYSAEEFSYLIAAEGATRLDDLFLRRTSLAFVGHLSADLVDEVAAVMAAELGWDSERTATEIARTWQILAESHGVGPHNKFETTQK
jgi:glycerol-3-phosphate dehydrogenase